MQAVILAAGLGTRMGEMTRHTPKPLLKIQDRTLLEHNLTAMPEEIDEVVLVVGYLKEQIRETIGESFLGKKITYVEQKELKGTGPALAACKDVLHGRFLVMMGDDLYYDKDLERLVKEPLGMLVWEMQNNDLADERQAIVQLGTDGILENIIERRPAPKRTMVNSGAYVLNADYFKYPLVSAGSPATEFGLPQTMLQMVKDGAKFKIVKAERWHKVASPEDLSSRPPSRDPETMDSGSSPE